MKEILCERCREKEASVYYKESINGKTREIHLCADCAKEMGVGAMGKSPLEEELFSSFPLFSEFIPRERKSEEGRVCPGCGKSREEIRKSGVFGCARCFDTFSKGLDLAPFIGRGYRGGRLSEKAAANQVAPGEKKENNAAAQGLKAKLAQALKEENYEQAAILRDQIRALEGK